MDNHAAQTSLRPYIKTMVRVLSRRLLWAAGLLLLLGMTEGMGLLMLVPLLSLVGLDTQHGSLGHIGQFVSSVFSIFGTRPTLFPVLIVFVAVTAIRAWLQRVQTVTSQTLTYELTAYLRQRLYRAITYANWLFLSRSRSSDFIHVLTAEVDRVGGATYHLLHLAVSSLLTLVYILVALKLSVLMTGLVFLCGGALMVLLRGKIRIARTIGEDLGNATSTMYSAVSDYVGGMKSAKSFSAEDRSIALFDRITEQVRQLYTRAVDNQTQAQFLFQVGSVVILGIIVYVSVAVVAVPAAQLLLLLFLFARIVPRLSNLQQGYQSFLNLFPAFERVAAMQARCEAAKESPSPAGARIRCRPQIEFRNVSFSYGDGDAVTDLNLTIPAGKTTALVGPSGAGKSTVVDLAIGLISPSSGTMFIDGHSVEPSRLMHWRADIGYVPQDTFLFHDTIQQNLLWACPEATDDELWEALRLAAADEFVSQLPHGLDTLVGDRGVRLSGGERQRIALARALLRKPALLVFDEATSNLDRENEARILQAVSELHGSVTILIVSHRPSTVRDADVTYVLDKGRLVRSEAREPRPTPRSRVRHPVQPPDASA